MAGTSHDGADFALVEIRGNKKSPDTLKVTLIQHLHAKYHKSLKERVRKSFAGNTDLICKLNFELGEFYARNVLRLLNSSCHKAVNIYAIASHGQTVYHMPPSGGESGSTLQIGEASVIAERTGITVVSDFRTRDMAAGGHGAPLVPLADYLLFAKKDSAIAVVNIGGIANVTVLKGKIENTIAFDIGPGNSLIDEAMIRISQGKKSFDRNGSLARKGRPDRKLLARLLSHPYLRRKPPKSSGREVFGEEMAREIFQKYRNLCAEDMIATLTHFSAEIIYRAIIPFVPDEVIISGGGTENSYLMGLIRDKCESGGIHVRSTLHYGIPSQAKEAVSFAILGYLTLNRLPGNLPSATGAKHEVVLGKITLP
jgi:anhydro-N-acetylmuramic acid kinase